MDHNPDPKPPKPDARIQEGRGNLYLLEICFLGLVGVVVVAAFFEALTYKLVSARTPYVIMVPLFLLIAIHARRLWRVRAEFDVGARLSSAISGHTVGLNKVIGISAWLAGLVLMITVFGHYAGIFLFVLLLMRLGAKEAWRLSLIVAAGSTLFIYGVFEFLFNIDLYRGLIVRYFLGFRDF